MCLRKIEFLALAAVIWVVGAGCKKPATDGAGVARAKGAGENSANSANHVARIHWVGMKRLSSDPNAAYFLSIWNMPESKQLEAQTLEKLATAPWRLLLHQK